MNVIPDKWDRRFIDLAEQIATWSKDPSTQIGAVAVDGESRRVVATGYNGFPRSIPDDPEKINTRSQKSRRIIHAEVNVICHAAEYGQSLRGCTLYVYGLPICGGCAPMVINVGIAAVVQYCSKVPDRWIDSCRDAHELFKEGLVDYYLYTDEGLYRW